MKILFACGGTAGHINPAISVADSLCSKYPHIEVLFAGNPNGMESKLVQKAGYPFAPIEVLGIQRKITPNNIKRNAKALYLLAKSSKVAKKIIEDFQPDIVMGTGGYVSGPVVRQAYKMGIKTLTHEQNAFPGVTTKLLAAHVDKVLIAMEGATKHLKIDRNKITVTGNPVREAIFSVDRTSARMRLGVGDRICILSFGGSLGANKVNQAVVELIKANCNNKNIHHIHATGGYEYKEVITALKEKGVDLKNPHIDVREYIDNMPTCLGAADLVICRSGAITLTELECAAKASILIPSPNVAENHQYHNAMELVNNNAAEILEEKDLTPESLLAMVNRLVEDKELLATLEKNAYKMAIKDANQRIIDEIIKLYNS